MTPNGPSMTPQDTVERALAAAKAGGETVVIADESSTANLRWAGNTLTTNGVAATRSLTVIAIDRRADGTAGVGTVSRSGITADQVEDLVREAEKAAEEAVPGRGRGGSDVRRRHGPFDIEWLVFAFERHRLRGLPWLRGAARRDAAGGRGVGRKLYGFAEHGVTSTFVGNSAGLRARYDQPGGRLELNAKSADLSRSAWAGASTRDFTDVDVAALDAGLAERLGWQERKVELPAGRYETLLPPTAVSDMLIYLYWSAGARDAGEGRTVFSKPGGGTRIGERLSPLPLDLFSDPAYPGLECAPFVVAHVVRPRLLGLRQRPAVAGRAAWISEGVLSALHCEPVLGRGGRGSGHAVGGQPDHDRAGRVRVAGRDDRLDQARAAAHLPVVHPAGRPADAAADRADQGRRLPGRERRGDGRGEQLPVQRVAGRRCSAGWSRRARRRGRCRASGATTSTGRRCRRCGWRGSTCRRSARRTSRVLDFARPRSAAVGRPRSLRCLPLGWYSRRAGRRSLEA